MTEKIARRGIHAPESYVPDILNSYKVKDVLKEEVNVISTDNTIGDVRKFILENEHTHAPSTFAVADEAGSLYGIIEIKDIFNTLHDEREMLTKIARKKPITAYEDETLKAVADKMLSQHLEILPIVSRTKTEQLVGVLTYRDIIEAYELREQETEKKRTISIKKRSIRFIIKGKRLFGDN
jgi:chloride channel protein, CIC family